jgi:MFS family permease
MGITGFMLGIGAPLTMSWVAGSAPPGSRGTVLGLRMTGNRVSQMLIPVAAGMLAAAVGPISVFALAGFALAWGAMTVNRSRG